jgi:hypothetical protein
MRNKSETYQAYLLRFWRQEEAKPWRVTVQCVGGEQHYHFASIDEAITFVLDQLEQEELVEPSQDSSSIKGSPNAPLSAR